jgi:hypothetical protein
MYQLMKTTKQKAKQTKTQKPHKKRQKTIIQTLAVLSTSITPQYGRNAAKIGV